MTIPSFGHILKKAAFTFKRFSLAIVAALVGTLLGCTYVHVSSSGEDNTVFNEMSELYVPLIMTCFLAVFLLVSLVLLTEKLKWSLKRGSLLQSIGILLLLTYYLTLPKQLNDLAYIRFVLYALGLFFSLTFVPFIGSRQVGYFWQYNRIFFARIFGTIFYALVIYIGIAIALLAIQNLFSINFASNVYVYLFVVIAGSVAPCFFLSNMPNQTDELTLLEDYYPKGLKIFVQYILLPLVTIYGLILYVYGMKIILTANWPIGWVAYLVIAFSVLGILSIALIWPLRNDEREGWIKNFSRFFYIGLLPLILLLSVAIYKRVSQYGITEQRYFIMLTAAWLTFIALYFLISKTKNLKVISISFCVGLFLSSFGPWGAFDISKKSQLRHLEQIFKRNNLLDKGQYKAGKINWEEETELSSVVQYLVEMHSAKVLQPYLRQNIGELLDKDVSAYSRGAAEKVLQLMNLNYVNSWERRNEFSLRAEDRSSVSVSGYDEYIPYALSIYQDFDYEKNPSTLKQIHKLGKDSVTVTLVPGKSIDIKFDGVGQILSLNLVTVAQKLANIKPNGNGMVPREDLYFNLSGKLVDMKICFGDIAMRREKEANEVISFSMGLLVRRK